MCILVMFKNVVYRFDSELTRALEEADNEREQKDKAIQENIALGAEIFSLHRTLKVLDQGQTSVICEKCIPSDAIRCKTSSFLKCLRI